jgi:hypothetical protein
MTIKEAHTIMKDIRRYAVLPEHADFLEDLSFSMTLLREEPNEDQMRQLNDIRDRYRNDIVEPTHGRTSVPHHHLR